MIKFVNAKINIGLSVTEKRQDGYHNLETIFYPIGKRSGLPGEPASFGDILEITPSNGLDLQVTGKSVDCRREHNLVWKAASLYSAELEKKRPGAWRGADIVLDKHIPDGAGLGGGSADASFTLLALNEMYGGFSEEELCGMAARLGADCPFFIYNRPMFGEGIGEILSPIELDLSGKWLVTVKKNVFVSTKDAFGGITPTPATFDLRTLPELPIEEWQDKVKNDFEKTVFAKFPVLAEVKREMIATGSDYASMTGSGAVIYGIFSDKGAAEESASYFRKDSTNTNVGLLSL